MESNATPVSQIDRKAFSVDQLRERLRPFDAVDIINEVQDTLREEWRGLGKNQIDALKLQVEIQFRKLAKVLPELKAMDHTIGEGSSKVNFVIHMDKTPSAPKPPTSSSE